MLGKLTLITSEQPSQLGKTFALEGSKLTKTTAAQMTAGSFKVRTFSNAPELVELLESFTTAQALCASLPSSGAEAGRIVTRKALPANPGAIARTKDAFTFPSDQGLMVCDYDPPKSGPVLSRDELWQAMVAVAPALADGLVLWWASGSSLLFDSETGAELAPLRGQRLYIGVSDLSDTPRSLEVLNQRLWLAGFGRVEVSEAGSLLERGLFDDAMKQTARLDFGPAGSVCRSGVEQRRGPPVVLAAGGFVDSRAVFTDLTTDELGCYEALIAEAREAKRNEAIAKREAWTAGRVAAGLQTHMAKGMSAAEAEGIVRKTIDSAFAGTLLGPFELQLVRDDGSIEVATVEQVLSNRETYNERDLLDPLNPGHRSGSPDCRLYLLSASTIAYSLDDSGKVYRLRRQSERIELVRGNRHEAVEHLIRAMSSWDDVFASDTGPVQIVGTKTLPLNANRLMLLIGARCALFSKGKGAATPTDLTRDVAELVLAAMY